MTVMTNTQEKCGAWGRLASNGATVVVVGEVGRVSQSHLEDVTQRLEL